ncbi:uncharacterized protein BDZ99DRAFT_463877 [Mytilinidion resinicola]|uniref:Uncharacterized protein n=1 Tax=Mytilinidion resinicola TaxID=574789 RepID=A0A6A6YJR2_9PEZI|nr:uncharacterized protein BDZ99DRAFT_463877 [Mytilinidion resinicola]KAF2809051.1 hypothetical protein BDZ99DRAFT_463877 [Mytilinidion resinicola]
MHWVTGGLHNFQLDIVGFLAILGEGSVLANAQVSTLSKWIFLPRLLPAPQALLRPTRPSKLEPHPGRVTGVYSGNDRDSINHIGNIVCDGNSMDDYSVRCVTVGRRNINQAKSKTVGPLTGVLFLGAGLSAVLLALSIYYGDGMSLLATALLSLLSSLIGWGNHWKLHLPKRIEKSGKVPRGDVVIRYPKGSFLVVKCEEDVARELYFAPESIEYTLSHAPAYRMLSLLGTLMLMGGVIALANAEPKLQIAWAGAYMLLNAAYWTVAALPAKLHWDTSCFKVTMEALSDSDKNIKGFPSKNTTFTQALWKVIVLTRNANWARRGEAAPDTKAWRAWMNDAQFTAQDAHEAEVPIKHGVKTWQVPVWNAQERLRELLDEQRAEEEKGVEEV